MGTFRERSSIGDSVGRYNSQWICRKYGKRYGREMNSILTNRDFRFQMFLSVKSLNFFVNVIVIKYLLMCLLLLKIWIFLFTEGQNLFRKFERFPYPILFFFLDQTVSRNNVSKTYKNGDIYKVHETQDNSSMPLICTTR